MTNEEILAYLKQYQNAGNHIHKEAMSKAIEALELKSELEKALPTLKHIVIGRLE